jgi:hypothetical protein
MPPVPEAAIRRQKSINTDEASHRSKTRQNRAYQPTLSELVLACGDQFDSLFRSMDDDIRGTWGTFDVHIRKEGWATILKKPWPACGLRVCLASAARCSGVGGRGLR